MFSERLKSIRKELGLSVAKMSDKMGVSPRTFTSYESGREPSLDFLLHLCKTFDVSANWFVTGKGEMFNAESGKSDNAELTKLIDERFKILMQDFKK